MSAYSFRHFSNKPIESEANVLCAYLQLFYSSVRSHWNSLCMFLPTVVRRWEELFMFNCHPLIQFYLLVIFHRLHLPNVSNKRWTLDKILENKISTGFLLIVCMFIGNMFLIFTLRSIYLQLKIKVILFFSNNIRRISFCE